MSNFKNLTFRKKFLSFSYCEIKSTRNTFGCSQKSVCAKSIEVAVREINSTQKFIYWGYIFNILHLIVQTWELSSFRRFPFFAKSKILQGLCPFLRPPISCLIVTWFFFFFYLFFCFHKVLLIYHKRFFGMSYWFTLECFSKEKSWF